MYVKILAFVILSVASVLAKSFDKEFINTSIDSDKEPQNTSIDSLFRAGTIFFDSVLGQAGKSELWSYLSNSAAEVVHAGSVVLDSALKGKKVDATPITSSVKKVIKSGSSLVNSTLNGKPINGSSFNSTVDGLVDAVSPLVNTLVDIGVKDGLPILKAVAAPITNVKN